MIQALKNILVSIQINAAGQWREAFAEADKLALKEVALFLDKADRDERRECYKILEASKIESIPYVQVTSEMEAWEFDLLVTNYGTVVFASAVSNKSFGILTTFSKYAEQIIFENPLEKKHAILFSDEALTRAGAEGVCLDAATLEHDRLHDEKKYTTTIHSLDHHPLRATQIRPLAHAWYRRLVQKEMRYLTDLTTLRYLRQMPAAYIAPLIVLDLENTLPEQIEIRDYLKTFLK
mgnify:CR=1 FL=1